MFCLQFIVQSMILNMLLHTSHTSGFTPSENMGSPTSPWLWWSYWLLARLRAAQSFNKTPPQSAPSLLLSGAAGCSGNDEA